MARTYPRTSPISRSAGQIFRRSFSLLGGLDARVSRHSLEIAARGGSVIETDRCHWSMTARSRCRAPGSPALFRPRQPFGVQLPPLAPSRSGWKVSMSVIGVFLSWIPRCRHLAKRGGVSIQGDVSYLSDEALKSGRHSPATSCFCSALMCPAHGPCELGQTPWIIPSTSCLFRLSPSAHRDDKPSERSSNPKAAGWATKRSAKSPSDRNAANSCHDPESGETDG